MGLIYQRTPHQCAIATIAMATGRDYDEVLAVGLSSKAYVEGKGCDSYSDVLEVLGYSNRFSNGLPVGDFVSRRCDYVISPQFFRGMAWGRRAIMTVPSLNNAGGHHSIFWDGCEVLDPNPPERKRYSAFDELLPSQMVLFRETAAAAAAVAG